MILWDTMNEVRNRTTSAPLGSMKYAYNRCLNDAIAENPTSCCRGKTVTRVEGSGETGGEGVGEKGKRE
ncbi:hypothetical protein SESBI_30876 [Sesbania bispinosa]|nr:hypothetical protein SESBI_30876 [Sesbania bispinosa]